MGVDIGGTKLAAGLVDADGTIRGRTRRDTPARDAARIPELVAEIAGELCRQAGTDSVPVGVGAAGIVDLDGVMRYSPNIDWADYPLLDELAGRIDAPVAVDNDANVAAWGEYRAGAGRAASATMLLLTVGTGVGGGLVLGDALVRGAHGLGAEFGHLIVAEGGPRCPCGNRGCLEAMASGTAIGRMAREEATADTVPDTSPLAEAALEDLTGKSVTLAAQDGDAFATDLLQRAGFWLGVGIASLINALDPEVVVVGGGAMQAGELLLAPARQAVDERILGRAHRLLPPIEHARLADDAGLIGAGLMALEQA